MKKTVDFGRATRSLNTKGAGVSKNVTVKPNKASKATPTTTGKFTANKNLSGK